MKRRNFCKSLIGAAFAAALPASAMRDILIHKGNSAGATFTHDGTGFAAFFANTKKFDLCPRPYQQQAIDRIARYGARQIFMPARQQGKTYWLEINAGDCEKRVLAMLDKKDKELVRDMLRVTETGLKNFYD